MSAWGAFKSCDSLISRIEQNDPTLEDLVILPTKTFGEAEVARLCAVLERCDNANTYFKSLRASGHSVPASSLRRMGTAIATTKATSFCSVAIGDRNMGDEGVSAFCEGLSAGDHSLESIDLSFKGMEATGFLTILQTMGEDKILKHLDLSRNQGIGNTDLSDIDKKVVFGSVKELDLSDCDISSALADQLFPLLRPGTGNVKRTLVRLSGNPIGEQGAESLKNLFLSTESVYLSYCQLGDQGIENFRWICPQMALG